VENKYKFIIVFALWLILILAFVGFKEYSIQTGTKILLKTVPVDPRDIFRGDYVYLNYEISNIAVNQFEKKEDGKMPDISIEGNANIQQDSGGYQSGDTIYVLLEKNTTANDTAYVIKNYSHEKPAEGLFIVGKVQYAYNNRINVQYGIESYFVPEGEGKKIEQAINNRTDNIIVYAQVSVDRFGNGVLMHLFFNQDEFHSSADS